MKGLSQIPSDQDLSTAYEALQFSSSSSFDASSLALWSQWARFDPRLAEILVAFIISGWRGISPVSLNTALRAQPWPSAFCVLLEQIRVLSTPKDPVFEKWSECTVAEIEPASNELFFIGLRKFAGALARRDAETPLALYLRWGYLGREVLVNKALRMRGSVTLFGPDARRRALEGLIQRARLENTRWITIRDYEAVLDGWVSRRQAERDLEAHPTLKARGRARARSYRV